MSVTVRILIYLSGNFPSYLTTQLGGINFSTAGTVQNLLFELSSSWWKEPHNVKLFISPQSELGAFYFCRGVPSGYCCVCECGYYHV